MKVLSSIFRSRKRLRPGSDAPRKRPSRTLALSIASLEPRALLAFTGPIAVTAASTAVAVLSGLTPTNQVTPPPPSTFNGASWGTNATASTGSGSSVYANASTNQEGPAPVVSPAPADPDGPTDRLRNHVALAEASVSVAGVVTPEFALADAGKSKVLVRVGLDGPVEILGAAQGVDRPQSVVLSDVNGDGIPDLLVANSGANNVLIFPGLPGGLFGPEVNDGDGFAVGQNPVSITVGNVNGDGMPDIVVANQGSNNVTILDGQGSGANWTAVPGGTIEVGSAGTNTAPVKTALVDVNHDGTADLFVCNSGSNNVYLYEGLGNGSFDTSNPVIFNVGSNPSELLLGRFDQREQLDLITLNSGSDNLTFIGGVLTARPTIENLSSGGAGPDAAFSVDLNHNGVLDLVVANGGDGHLALLKGTNEGMQLAGVITQSDLPVPTGLAPAAWNSDGLDFLAASAGQDAAELLHFDLSVASIFLASPLSDSGGSGQASDELIAQLLPLGESGLELIAVLWAGSPDSAAVAGEWGLREPTTVTALYAPTEGQGIDDSALLASLPVVTNPNSIVLDDLLKDGESAWPRFVFGFDEAFGQPRVAVEAIASRDAREIVEDRPIAELARLDTRSVDPEVEAASGAVDEALRLYWSEGRSKETAPPSEATPDLDPARRLEGIDAPALDVRIETVPLISSVVLLSSRLILKASPPRPPSFRKPARRQGGFRLWGAGPDPGRKERP